MATKQTSAKRSMTDQHKRTIQESRIESRAVSEYLLALEVTQGPRARRRSPDAIKTRLAAVDDDLKSAGGAAKLLLLQEQENLSAELLDRDDAIDITAFEEAFVEHAAAYGGRKGISYAVWRKAGVAPAVLRKAGISRGH